MKVHWKIDWKTMRLPESDSGGKQQHQTKLILSRDLMCTEKQLARRGTRYPPTSSHTSVFSFWGFCSARPPCMLRTFARTSRAPRTTARVLNSFLYLPSAQSWTLILYFPPSHFPGHRYGFI